MRQEELEFGNGMDPMVADLQAAWDESKTEEMVSIKASNIGPKEIAARKAKKAKESKDNQMTH